MGLSLLNFQRLSGKYIIYEEKAKEKSIEEIMENYYMKESIKMEEEMEQE